MCTVEGVVLGAFTQAMAAIYLSIAHPSKRALTQTQINLQHICGCVDYFAAFFVPGEAQAKCAHTRNGSIVRVQHST